MRFFVLASVAACCSFAACAPTPETPPTSRFGSDLHEHPAACGQAAYAWVDDDALGSVVDRAPLRIAEVDDSAAFIELLRDNDAADVVHVPKRRVFLDRFRYVTQDRGQLVEATGLYAFPDPKEVTGPLPLVVYTHGTSGYSDACAPSRLAESPAATDAALVGIFASVFDADGAGGGAIVVAPDYLGLNGFGAPSSMSHPYLVAEPTAVAALDAARAAFALAAEDGEDISVVTVAGASQGGHAAALTARYQPHYAADLPFAGVVSAIPPTDLLAQATRAVSGGLAAPVNVGNIVAVLVAAQRWYGVPREALFDVVNEEFVAGVEATMDETCVLPEIDADLDDVFTADAVAAAEEGDFGALPGPWGCIFARSSLIDTDVEKLDDDPRLVVTGEDDDLVDPVVERAAAELECARGETLVFQECAGRDHGGAFLSSIDDMLFFLEARVRGDDVDGVCDIGPARVCGSDPR